VLVEDTVESLFEFVKENMFSFYLFSVPQGLMFNGQQKSSLYCSEEGAVVFLGL